jgi:hypothetical protein
MKYRMVAFAVVLSCLVACDKAVPALPDDPVTVPVPESSIPGGQSGDEGIDSGTKSESEKSLDQDIQTEPSNPDGDGSIVIPPPVVDMPPEIVPEKP